jgi:ring-1,2-phenylacetyl-CoA epoxidase subunit PaaD
VREISLKNEKVIISITPTYIGCPAMKVFEDDILQKLKENGFENVEVKKVLQPAWTTDWMTQEGRNKLKAYGIAPPVGSADKGLLSNIHKEIRCPQCGSKQTEIISQFGSTPCKSLYKCLNCLEPFDYFKCI